MVTRRERVEGGLVGLLVGDALGVPYEFHPPDELPARRDLEFDPPPGFRRAHPSVMPGTWSDDGAQALCLLESWLDCGGLDLVDFSRRLLAWRDHGHLAVGGRVFDVGLQTNRALDALRAGVPPDEAGPRAETANGNGSLMRVLPLALVHEGDDAALFADARRSSLPTHAHLRAQLCCGLYCLWIRRLLDGHEAAWDDAVTTARALLRPDAAASHELVHGVVPDAPPGGRGSGYVVDTLHGARWAVAQGSFEQALQAAVSLGHDTDTTAAVVGGAAGVRDGIGAIPHRWRAALRGEELLAPLRDRLLARVRGG